MGRKKEVFFNFCACCKFMCNKDLRDAMAGVMILHYNTTLTPSSKAIYSGTKYYDTHIEFHSLFLDVSATDV